MSFSKVSRGQNGAQSQRMDLVRSPSLQQHGDRKNLFERLKTDTPHSNRRRQHGAAEEHRYVDVTAAFFAGHRRQAPQANYSAPLHLESLRHGPLFSGEEQQRQLKNRNPPQEPQAPESPLTEELKSNIATQSGLICSDSSATLDDMYEALKGAMDIACMENDRALAKIEFHHEEIAMPLSEIMCENTLTNAYDKSMSRNECRLGSVLDSVRERIKTLEAEVGQLWNDWEAAELEVQDTLASVSEGGDYGSVGQKSPINNVQGSLALDIEGFDEELLNIIEESHEAAKLSEKDFAKKINAVMNALLQQYLMGD